MLDHPSIALDKPERLWTAILKVFLNSEKLPEERVVTFLNGIEEQELCFLLSSIYSCAVDFILRRNPEDYNFLMEETKQ